MRLESIVNESTVPVYMPDFGIREVPLLPVPQLHSIIPIKDVKSSNKKFTGLVTGCNSQDEYCFSLLKYGYA
jgi:hypothetical protein